MPSLLRRARTSLAHFFNGDKLPTPQADTSWERIQMSLRLRFNPIRDLTPEKLANYLDNFRLGFFRFPMVTWDAMERRDTRLVTVTAKRKKTVARRGWEILTKDDSAEATRQKEQLEYFYDNLSATTALEPDERGGMGLLVRQMMDAVGKRYATHEIVWQPKPSGLQAQFIFCPPWWFEGTRGKLRYLQQEMAIYGEDMEPGGWMTTVGDGIMEACSVAYMFKHMPLKDWVSFSEKFGFPGVVGETDAQLNSPEWEAMEEAVKSLSSDWGAVVKAGKLTLLEAKNSGQLPFPPLVELMNEEMTRTWLGSDLGTSSKANAVGASLQGDSADLLEEDDAKLISETLNNGPTKMVREYYFGPDAPELAYLKIKTPEKDNTERDLKIDQFLLSAGAPLSVKDALERYDRPQPDDGEELLKPAAAPAPEENPDDPPEDPNDPEMANVADAGPSTEFEDNAQTDLLSSILQDHRPLLDQLNAISKITDPALLAQRLSAWLERAQKFVAQLENDSATQHALTQILAASFANGLAAQSPKS